MPLDTGNVRRLHLVADADTDEAPIAVGQPSLEDGADIGLALKAAREFRGLTTQDVADGTRIRQSYIEALEDMRLDDLPSRPFTIGYVRAYAGLLGLDAEAAVARFKNDAPDEGAELRAPVGVRRERDPRLALIFAGGLLVVGAILLWNVAQRAISKDEPPPQIAPESAQVRVAHGGTVGPGGSVSLGAPLPAPVESTTPEPYKTPGLDDAAANGGSVDAAKLAAKARAEAEAAAGITDTTNQVVIGAPFKPKGQMLGAGAAEASGVLIQARKAGALTVRRADGGIHMTRWLSAGDAYSAPRTPGLILDVVEPALFEVYYNGRLTGRLTSNQTAVARLIPAAPAPVVAATAPNAR
ncbi:helix-turn-helix domain-containing protein [Caulobacter vibrioides]|uniref:helix-turn-helix domain-containing protein n=1 Tax=Caulobacter vibrioides TaxID=155892 RepID=UPI000BB470A9|nr:helix-turn-helix domain-containing protein [Caulobacter vibrioides]ATC23816.1 cell division protein FtsQ [Caulobacter vibrioides]AZH12055.1 helix-turn-helix domain-containing protein [Caulobacter vibrioides]PLR15974.1 cell division protein FtsQ [Caulobacter vibrioides]